MRFGRFLGGSLLTAAVLAACSDTAPTVPASEDLNAARLGEACAYHDNVRTRVRTVAAGCLNSEITVPEGWTLRVHGASPAVADAIPATISPFFTPIGNPDAAYIAATELIDISGIADFTNVTSVSDGTQTVTFNVTMNKRSVGGSWGTWSCPPFSETCTPHILFTQGQTSVEMTLSVPSSIFGFELEPNPFGPATFTAQFFSGATLVGSVTREVDGFEGARLFAASGDGESFDRVVVSGPSDFAIANLRYAEGTQQPPIEVEIEDVYSGDPRQDPGVIDLSDEWVYVEILDVEQYLSRSASPDQVRIGDSYEDGTPAESFQILDINGDGDRDIRVRFSLEELVADGNLTPNTQRIVVWGQDNGQVYRGTAEVTVIGGGEPGTLTTAPANNGSGGIFMDLTPTRLAHVTSFETPFGGDAGTQVEVAVWTRPGSYVGFDSDPTGWTLTQTVTATRAGTAVNAPIVLDTPIVLQAGQTTAVYLHAVTGGLGAGIRYTGTAASPPQTTWSNDDLTLFSDVARTGDVSFGGSRFTPRTFSGNVNYLIFP